VGNRGGKRVPIKAIDPGPKGKRIDPLPGYREEGGRSTVGGQGGDNGSKKRNSNNAQVPGK